MKLHEHFFSVPPLGGPLGKIARFSVSEQANVKFEEGEQDVTRGLRRNFV